VIAQEAAQHCGENIVLHHMRMYNFSFGIYNICNMIAYNVMVTVVYYITQLGPLYSVLYLQPRASITNVQVVGSSRGDLTQTGTELMTNVPIPILV